jgi:hypothetical protein
LKLTVDAETVYYEEMISGFRRNVEDILAVRGFYGLCNVKYLLAFRDKLSFPPSGVKKSKIKVAFIFLFPLKLSRNFFLFFFLLLLLNCNWVDTRCQ